jgi:integrase
MVITSLTLTQEHQCLRQFMMSPNVLERDFKPVREVTAKTHEDRLMRILGWKYRYCQVPLGELKLQRLIPSSGLSEDGQLDRLLVREALQEFLDFLTWLREERKCNIRYEVTFISAMVMLAKFLYGSQSSRIKYFGTMSDGSVGFRDIPVIEALRQLQAQKAREAKRAPLVADETKKWIDWPDFLELVDRLRRELGAVDAPNNASSARTNAALCQKFLILGMISELPDRQRTFRELEENKTLFKRKSVWQVEHGPEDIKVPSFAEVEKRVVPLPPWLYPELEAWLHGYEDSNGHWHGWIDENNQRTGWRSVFKPTHDFVFTQQNGKPYNQSTFCASFKATTYRYTGQICNPHLIRDMVVTHLKKRGTPEDVMKSVAILMGHSSETQNKNYDRRSNRERIQPALDLLSELRMR